MSVLMRLKALPVAAMFMAGLMGLSLVSQPAHAQYGGGGQGGGGRGGGQGGKGDSDDAEKAKKKEEEWGDKTLQLEKSHADGPCPYVKVLYDAARYIDFENGKESTSAVRYSGEINKLVSDCAYKGDSPITIKMVIGFSLGKGPKAPKADTVYRYWVAVTERDKQVLEKTYFDLPVTFDPNSNVKNVATRIDNIVIPRGSQTISGNNFEVLVGFDVTPKMAEFNADGKRFRVVRSDDK